jgi:hypothetical protein
MTLEILEDSKGNEVVFITNEDGTTLSMLKETYDKQRAEQSTPILSDEAKTK